VAGKVGIPLVPGGKVETPKSAGSAYHYAQPDTEIYTKVLAKHKLYCIDPSACINFYMIDELRGVTKK